MSLPRFETFLRETMGMDAASVGSATIERAVLQRAAAVGLGSLEDYALHLGASRAEQQKLIEAVVVPETWFFRDPEAFHALARLSQEPRFLAEHAAPLRLLSLPCSTGEEPFTMVMALRMARVPASRFRIDAIDISERVLGIAARGLYGKNSFRGRELGFQKRFFCQEPGGYRLAPELLDSVTFAQGNLLDPGFLPGALPYDVVFCRNVLIYFDRPTQERAMAVLRRLLHPQGMLFVGPSESSLVLSHGFTSAKIPHAFGFFKTPEPAALSGALPAAKPARTRLPAPATPAAKAPMPAPDRRPALPLAREPAPARPALDALENARRLADRGALEEAAAACRAHLQSHGPDARAFYLLGLVRGAAGQISEAAEHYRKALYLEPAHSESLVHLALILEQQGNARGAQLLRDRSRRLAPHPPLPS